MAEIMNDWRSPKVREFGEVLGSHLNSYGWVLNSIFNSMFGASPDRKASR